MQELCKSSNMLYQAIRNLSPYPTPSHSICWVLCRRDRRGSQRNREDIRMLILWGQRTRLLDFSAKPRLSRNSRRLEKHRPQVRIRAGPGSRTTNILEVRLEGQ